MTSRNKINGFTLIELLVVVSIIGLLGSSITSSMVEARVKARDLKRVQDLAAIRTALELYYLDNHNYPETAATDKPSYNWIVLEQALSPYIQKLPVSPPGPAAWLRYEYDGNASGHCIVGDNGTVTMYVPSFYLIANLERANEASKNDGGVASNALERYGGKYSVDPNFSCT